MLGETRTKLAQEIEAAVGEGATRRRRGADGDDGRDATRGPQPRRRRRPRRRVVRAARRRDPRRGRARGPGPGPAVRLPGRRAQAVERRDAWSPASRSARATRTRRSAPAWCSCPPTACSRCCRSGRSARTSPRRSSTASRAGGRSTAATRAGAWRTRSSALSIDTRAQRQARRLSGGNQQKLTLARWLAAGFTTMLCFDPTRGIDVGTKRQIYALLRELAEAGAAVLLFTSELPEIQLVCDRTIVVYRGAVTAEMPALGGGRGGAAEGRARAQHDGGGGMTTVEEATAHPPPRARLAPRRQPARLDDRRLRPAPAADHRLHLGARPGDVHVVRPQDDRHRRPAARVRRDGAGGDRDLRRHRPLARRDGRGDQRARRVADGERELRARRC